MTHQAGAPEHAVVDGGRDAAWDGAWAAALDALEMDVDEAERMLAVDHLADEAGRQGRPAWTPPTGLPPLPAALVERARALLDRQLAVAEQLAQAAALSRRHHRAAEAMRSAPPAPPVYVDTPA